MKANLNELDAMLHDLSRGQYKDHQYNTDKATDIPPERPPPPKGYGNENASNNSNFLQVRFPMKCYLYEKFILPTPLAYPKLAKNLYLLKIHPPCPL